MTFAATLLIAATFTQSMERIKSIDPIKAQSVYASRAVELVYETPLEIDYTARPYRLIPGLCELPTVSEDGLVYTFTMCADAPLGPVDVRRALVRLQDVDGRHGSLGAWTVAKVKDIRVLDERTFEVELTERQHVFPWLMAMSTAAVPKVDGSGTGPYRLRSWWRNHEMVFVRNEEWRGWADNPRPFDTVRYLVVDDPSTQWLMFLKGEIDCLTELSRSNWSVAMEPDGTLSPRLAKRGIEFEGGESALDIRYIGMNMQDPVLGRNRKLRQALTCAFDFETWKRFYNYAVDPAYGPVPPCVSGCLMEPSPYGYDLERAKRLLAEAGYPGGIDPATGRRLELRLAIGRQTQESRAAGELLASFYARIGIRLELDPQTWAAFLDAVNRGDVQLFQMAWVGDYPDAENFLQLFYSKNRSPGPNHSNYANPEFDRAYEAAMAAATEDERNRHWRRCQEIVREDCPWIFTHLKKNCSLVNRRVDNFVSSDFPYGREKFLRTRE